MKTCSQCKLENLDTANFCNKCGTSLKEICAHCGAQNQPESKFCAQCGTRMETEEIDYPTQVATVRNM